jgi:hypothetical protein
MVGSRYVPVHDCAFSDATIIVSRLFMALLYPLSFRFKGLLKLSCIATSSLATSIIRNEFREEWQVISVLDAQHGIPTEQ